MPISNSRISPYRVPSAIPTRNGSLFVTVQDHYYWLYKFLEGRVVERLNRSHLAQLAQMMTRYHALIEKSNLHNGKPASDLYPIHSDLISENLLWKQGKLAGVIDFEHVSETNDPIVKDLAVTMQYCCRDNKVKNRLDIDSASRFLQACREYHPLSNKEVVLIPDLITAGFAEDFVFAFWMIRNDPKRAKQSEEEDCGLTMYSRAAQWSHSNRERITQSFLNEKVTSGSNR